MAASMKLLTALGGSGSLYLQIFRKSCSQGMRRSQCLVKQIRPGQSEHLLPKTSIALFCTSQQDQKNNQPIINHDRSADSGDERISNSAPEHITKYSGTNIKLSGPVISHNNSADSSDERISHSAPEYFMKDSGTNIELSGSEEQRGVKGVGMDKVDLSQLKPAPQPWAYNLAAYVSSSETLSNLVKLGADLHTLEKKPEVGNMLMRLNFERDVQPVLVFLHDIGIADDHIGKVLTKFPQIFKEDLDNLQIRVNYFESKRFSKTAIAAILTRHPSLLHLSTKEVDLQLGVLQKDFMLKGNEVRDVVARFPKIVTWPMKRIKDNTFALREFMDFDREDLKKMILQQPKLFILDKHKVAERYNYLCEEMEIEKHLMVAWPWILQTRIHILKQRHMFLKFLGKDQLDPKKENYVSLQALVSGEDSVFCEKIAQVTVQDFNDFLKTL